MRATAARAESRGVLVLRTTARNCATSRAAPHPPCGGSDAADDSRERALRRKCNCTFQTDVDRDLACKSDVPTDLKVTLPSQLFFVFFPQPVKGRLGWQGLKANEYSESGPAVVSSAHFRNQKIEWDKCPHVSQARYEMDTNIQLSAGDILLMKDGAAMGKLAFVDHLPAPACLNSHLVLFRPLATADGPKYDPKFLFYFMLTNLFQDYVKVNGTGATFLGVSQEALG